MARGRKPIEVSENELLVAIRTAEANQPDGKFPNRSKLWEAIENSEWAKQCNPRPLTAQVAMNLAKEFNITINTPVGKRGREKGQGPVNVTGKRKKREVSPETLKELRVEFPDMNKAINQIAAGSFKAAIKLKCLDCCGGVKKEVGLCTVVGCALFPFRPYQHPESKTAEGRNRISLGVIQGVNDEANDD